jgi:hypothetical protein
VESSLSKQKDNTHGVNMEYRILVAMKTTLTGVIKDTTVPPGHRHPLSDTTIEDIRQCLMLISAREQELIAESGESANLVPRYADEPQTAAVVPISSIGKPRGKKDPE